MYQLRYSSELRNVWGGIVDHGRQCMQKAGGQDVAVSLEVCPETWQLQGATRLHVHVFLKSQNENLRLRYLHNFDFEGVRPHVATSIG